MRAWKVSPARARHVQQELGRAVRLEPLAQPPRLIAGVDVSNQRFSHVLYAAAVFISYPSLEQTGVFYATMRARFPYIPGLLSFREAPVMLRAIAQAPRPDLLIVDGQGIAHPQALGVASHLGVLLDIPTIGCAKSILFGVVEDTAVLHPVSGDRIGALVHTKKHAKPLIVSPGHRITLDEAVEWVGKLTDGYRLPEPTRLAHVRANEYRKFH